MIERPWTKVDTLVADTMSSYWVNFTKNGDPNGKGLPEWKPYNSNSSEILKIGENTGMIPITKTEDHLMFLESGLPKE